MVTCNLRHIYLDIVQWSSFEMKKQDHNPYGISSLTGQEVRESFRRFFANKLHKFVPSSNIAPKDDPSILFTNAGMNQFKGIFLGESKEEHKRAVNWQKCLRVSGKHNDLDDVGRDGTHHTFFEMLGSWSFGDYYKKEAIIWAWELLTQVWNIPKERLFVTVYKDDDEAHKIWQEYTDIKVDRILRFDKDNFWEMGSVGPCGPCTEIHFDKGDLATQEETFQHKDLGVNGENERYVEIWNLVFIQFERLQDGSIKPLSKKHVDTGAGLERICAILQGSETNYQTDLFAPIIDKITELTQIQHKKGLDGMAHCVIADHVRTLTFAICDSITPGNEGRGYVIRRILRRASRYSHQLGQKNPFLYKLVSTVISIMKESYPELPSRQNFIEEVIRSEEQRFLNTLDQGLQKMDRLVKTLEKKNEHMIKGEDVFLFHDTYGFPLDLTKIIAEENNLTIDEISFKKHMKEQQDRARKSAKFSSSFLSEESWVILDPSRETCFLGYDSLDAQVKTTRFKEENDCVYIVFDSTPFYAESGGQIGDIGYVQNQNLKLKVKDTIKVLDLHVHKCTLIDGLVSKDNLSQFTAQVDVGARHAIMKNHSATHLLHAALKKALGSHVNQQGSYVGYDRLRFDFTHHKGLSKDELEQIETTVNEKIQENLPVKTDILPLEQAKSSGAEALFGEKYDDFVRVLSMEDFSHELCGGTHVKATGEIGVFQILSEVSIAAGIRRVEAITGNVAIKNIQKGTGVLEGLEEILKVNKDTINKKVSELKNQVKEQEKLIRQFESERVRSYIKNTVVSKKKNIRQSFDLLVTDLDSNIVDKKDLQGSLDTFRDLLPQGIAIITHCDKEDKNLSLLISVGRQIRSSFDARVILKQILEIAPGRGGGKTDRVRAGINSSRDIDVIIEKSEAIVEKIYLEKNSKQADN